MAFRAKTRANATVVDMYLMVEPVPHVDYASIRREVAPIHLRNCLRLMGEALQYMRPGPQVLAAPQAGSVLERGPPVRRH